MALASASPLSLEIYNWRKRQSLTTSNSRRRTSHVVSFQSPAKTEHQNWKVFLSTSLASVIIGFGALSSPFPATADLNKFEADVRGEFGIGSAAQFGSAELMKSVHQNENFRRTNFTSANMRESDLSGSIFTGAYVEKAVVQISVILYGWHVLTRSDLGGAIIEGADFSDAVIDLSQKQSLCKYASGNNPTSRVEARISLGCGNSRRNAYGSPSSPVLSAPAPKMLDKDGFCDQISVLCDAK